MLSLKEAVRRLGASCSKSTKTSRRHSDQTSCDWLSWLYWRGSSKLWHSVVKESSSPILQVSQGEEKSEENHSEEEAWLSLVKSDSNQIIISTWWFASDCGATIYITWAIIRLPWPEAILPKDQHPCSFLWPSQKLYKLQGDIRLGITVSPEGISQIWYQVCVQKAILLEVAVVNMLLWSWMRRDGAALTSHVLSQSMQFWLQSDPLSLKFDGSIIFSTLPYTWSLALPWGSIVSTNSGVCFPPPTPGGLSIAAQAQSGADLKLRDWSGLQICALLNFWRW